MVFAPKGTSCLPGPISIEHQGKFRTIHFSMSENHVCKFLRLDRESVFINVVSHINPRHHLAAWYQYRTQPSFFGKNCSGLGEILLCKSTRNADTGHCEISELGLLSSGRFSSAQLLFPPAIQCCTHPRNQQPACLLLRLASTLQK